MANLNRVVYLSEEQKNTLFSTGSVTSGTTTITYNDNDIYITPQEYDNSPTSGSNNLMTSGAIYNAISNAPGYNKVGTVTNVQVQATGPVVSSNSAAASTSLNTTISLADGYGDTKNPYGTKIANTVLAAPSGSAGTPVFRSLVTDDIPTLSVTQIDMTERRKYYFGLENDGSWLNITPGASVPGENDLNNFTTEGLNAYFTSTSRMVGSFPNVTWYTLSNIPSGGASVLDKGPGFLKVIRVTSNRIYQLVGLQENIFIRLYNGSEWGSWKELTNSDQSLFSSEIIHAYPDYSDASTPNEYLWETDADYQAFLAEMLEFMGYEYDENLEEYNNLSLGTFLNNFYNFVIGQLQILQETTLQYDFNEEAYLQHYIAGDPEDDYQVATKHYVDQSFAANDAMIFKGTLAGAASTTYTPAANRGDTYKVSTAGLINGEKVEVGDILICITDSTVAATSSNVSTIKNNWTIVQTNLDGVVIGPTTATNNAIALFNNAGNLIKDSAKTITTTAPTSSSTNTTIPTSKAVWDAFLPLSGGTVTGTVVLSKTQDLSGTANNSPALIIGGAATAAHMELDSNEIQAKTNGTSVAQLYINNDGGLVTVGSGGLAITSLTPSQAVSTDANKKLVSTNLTVSDPTASGTGITYIATISQSATGKITAAKSTVRSASTSQTGVTQYTEANTNTQLSTLTTTWTATPTDDTLFIRRDTGGGATFGQVKFSTLWTYIKGKITAGTYWANIKISDAAAYNAAPEMATLKLNGNTGATVASTSNVTLVYDSTNQALNFIFA